MSKSPQIVIRATRAACITPRQRRCVHIPVPSPHPNHPVQFSIPSLLPSRPASYAGKGKGKAPDPKKSNEEEVEDAEWEMRVGKSPLLPKGLSRQRADRCVGAGMLHLRETLPLLLHSGHSSSDLFPPEIFSSNVVLKLPAPLPIRVSIICRGVVCVLIIQISSLPAYSMLFSIARNGMQGKPAPSLQVTGKELRRQHSTPTCTPVWTA